MFVTYVCPYYILFCVKERICRSKHLQLASGTNVSIFWFVTFVWDLASFIFVAFWVITVMMCYKAQINYGEYKLRTNCKLTTLELYESF